MHSDKAVAEEIAEAKSRYRDFLNKCRSGENLFRLTPNSEPSAFARCFWVYGMHLIGENWVLTSMQDQLITGLHKAVEENRLRHIRKGCEKSKAYRQLLTFTLSALAVLDDASLDLLAGYVKEQLPDNLEEELHSLGCLRGVPQSGNQAMFLAIFLLHARDYLGLDTQRQIEKWVELHLRHMNRFGFWGDCQGMSHLQFQNGYHQYEILEYLHTDAVPWGKAAEAVASLMDTDGHFAPYPGGGGCYDYDAVYILSAALEKQAGHYAELLQRTRQTILSEQNDDGGFCESKYIRPRSTGNLSRSLFHVLSASGRVRLERARMGIALLRSKYNRIQTHWSQYSRQWGESDLWDSWFRMLLIARIDVAIDPDKSANWGFIDYPGIGFHPSVRRIEGKE
jgi:hypothetical protein